MKTIKFRAWDKSGNYFIRDFRIEKNGEIDVFGGFHGEIILEQFTGLKDKNEKDCYEGDIVRWEINEDLSIFKRSDKKFSQIGVVNITIRDGVIITNDNNKGIIIGSNWGENMNDFEIIGNIHENQDLLKN